MLPAEGEAIVELPAIGTHAVSLFTRVPELRRGPRGGALLRPHQSGEQWFGAASLHAEIDVWTVGAPEEFRGHGGTGGVGGQRGRCGVQCERTTHTEPCHHPAPGQTEG